MNREKKKTQLMFPYCIAECMMRCPLIILLFICCFWYTLVHWLKWITSSHDGYLFTCSNILKILRSADFYFWGTIKKRFQVPTLMQNGFLPTWGGSVQILLFFPNYRKWQPIKIRSFSVAWRNPIATKVCPRHHHFYFLSLPLTHTHARTHVPTNFSHT